MDAEISYELAERIRKPRLLVAEDDEDARIALSTLLDARYTLDLEACAHDAIERFALGRPDVLVLDYALPDVTGVRLLEAIRDYWEVSPPAIMISAYPDRRSLCEASGFHAFVQKPFRTLDLVWAIESALLLPVREGASSQ